VINIGNEEQIIIMAVFRCLLILDEDGVYGSNESINSIRIFRNHMRTRIFSEETSNI